MAEEHERPEIDSPEALEAWLADKPADWAQVIAVRAALRVFPLVFQVHEDPDQGFDADLKLNLILQVFRASFISRLALIYPRSEIRTAVSAAAKAAAATAANYASAIPFARAAAAAASAARASTRTSAGAVVIAPAASSVRAATSASAAAVRAHAGADADDAINWRAVSEDCLRLLAEHGASNSLLDQPLWLSDVRERASYRANFPPWIRQPFDRFAARDEVKSGPWGLIVDWYRAILPNSLNAEPRSLFGETADIAIATQPDEFWTVTEGRSAEDVLRDIERIRDGKSARVASSYRTSPDVDLFEDSSASISKEHDVIVGMVLSAEKLSSGASEQPNNFVDEAGRGDTVATEASSPIDAVPTHSDEPTGDDQLGRRPFARALVERMAEVQQAGGRDGFAIHLHAPWGAGKTSILHMMDAMLQKPEQGGKPWVVVHFNAWEHERRKPPWWPLIQALRTDGSACLLSYGTRWRWFRFRRTHALWWAMMNLVPLILAIVALAVVIAVVAWPSFGVPSVAETEVVEQTGVPTIAETIFKLLDLAFKVALSLVAAFGAFLLAGRAMVFGSADGAKFFYDLSRDPLERVRKLFAALVKATRAPVCIFIDDLDRCNADYVVDLLEGIQTSFRHRNVIYVAAADRAWLRASFEQRYSNFSGHVGNAGQPLGYLFLEKVFQVSTPVPGMGGLKKGYWDGLLKTGPRRDRNAPEMLLDPEAEVQETTRGDDAFDRDVRARRDEIRREFGTDLTEEEVADRLETTTSETERAAIVLELSASRAEAEEVEHLLASFVDILPDNPRVMKRMINTYAMRRAIGHLEGNPVGREVLARWTILEQRFPALADLLIEHPGWADMLVKKGMKVIDMPQALQPFAGDKDVVKVLGEPGSEHPLREGDIATITRGSAT